MAQPSSYWGFITPDGAILRPEPGDEHHRDIARRFLVRERGLTGDASRMLLLERDFIAFDVSEEGYCELIGGRESSTFRQRVAAISARHAGGQQR